MMEAKARLHQVTEVELAAAAERVRELAQRADDLRTLLAALPAPGEAAPPPSAPGIAPATVLRLAPPADLRDFPPRRTGLTPPVPGALVSGFGEPAADGSESLGLVLESLTEAQVVAPHDGQVVFRGPFRGYGEILIIEHRGGYHTLLAGLGRIDAVVGQWLLAGEPVGVMPPGAGGKPRLYVELRRNGRPINPWPWLEANISKVE
jgi:septal ring factor EnvC (AmiA/AmiB activator)